MVPFVLENEIVFYPVLTMTMTIQDWMMPGSAESSIGSSTLRALKSVRIALLNDEYLNSPNATVWGMIAFACISVSNTQRQRLKFIKLFIYRPS
jgi:hypothetical protein